MKTNNISSKPAELISHNRAPRSLWKDALNRLFRNKAAITGLIIVVFFSLIGIFAPLVSPYNPMDVPETGNSLRQAAWVQTGNPRTTGDSRYILGTDAVGHDVLSQVIWGARTSMVVGFIPMLIVLVFGTVIGLTAGFVGGRMDTLLMRLTDVFYAFPDLLFFILMTSALRDAPIGRAINGLLLLFIALSIMNWVTVARLVRGQVLALKEEEFILAARASGCRGLRIVLRHILPNSLGPIIVLGAFLVPRAIIAEASLGFLGLGIRPASDPLAMFHTSWGMLILWGRSTIRSQQWLLIAPAICIAVVMLAFTFVGDGLGDALDPKRRKTG